MNEVINVQQEFWETGYLRARKAIIVIPVVDLKDEFKYECRFYVNIPDHGGLQELTCERARYRVQYTAQEKCKEFINRGMEEDDE